MAHAYTPGLKVSRETTLRKVRRLPLAGEVLVHLGQRVAPATIVARTEVPGDPHTVNVANILGIEPGEVPARMTVAAGEVVTRGQLIASSRGFLGLSRREARSPVDGRVEMVSGITGQVTLREHPVPVEINAYLSGVVGEVLPGEGVVVESTGALVQGIFGVGGETHGPLRVAVDDPGQPLEAHHVRDDDRGRVLVGGSLVSQEAIRKAIAVEVAALVAGGVVDQDLTDLLGRSIGVAITGHEDIPLTLLVTEGFGPMPMAPRTLQLLQALDGQTACVNGATQIRAGVLRPEIIIPYPDRPAGGEPSVCQATGLAPGTLVRIIREPAFGKLARVRELPPELVAIETEARVRVLRARLEDGAVLTVPRANVEIMEVD
ncbi:MAG: hypothetical protein RDU89_03750 [bacterium]|nr:hypothetical protein [bacterium]